MKNSAVLSTCFTLASFCLAQTVEFIEPRNVQNVPQAEFSTFTVKGNFYVLQKKFRMQAPVMHDLELLAFDAKGAPTGANQIDKSLENGDANIYEGIFSLSDRMVMFKSEFKKPNSIIYAYPFDANGKRGEKTELTSFPAEKAMNAGNFQVNVSEDGSKIVVLCELPYVKETNEKSIVIVYDNTFKELWRKEYEFPYAGSKAPHNDVFVNNVGVVFDLKRIEVKKQSDFFTMFTFIDKGNSIKESKPDLGVNGIISTYKTALNPSGDLLVSGYYYSDKKVGVNVDSPIGPFMMKVSATDGSIPVCKISAFSNSKQNLKLLYLLKQADGALILVGEQQYVNSSPKPGTTTFEYDYEYNNTSISACKIGADGSMNWEYNIKKDVKSKNDGGRFMNCYAWMNDEKLMILYEDFLYQHDGKQHTVVGPDLSWQMTDVIETIGGDGKKVAETYIKDIRIGGKKGEYMLLPSTGRVLTKNSIFMLGARGLELVGIKITL